MIRRFACIVLIVLTVVPALSAYAVTSDFRVRTFVGDDTTPPTVPTGLTATPVASSQIDLAWLPSTDDFELTGYHVWRDNVVIATTTSTSYVDTGLTASTTYTYSVSAYDHFFNESATSTSVSTTTFSIPVPPPDTSDHRYGFRLTPLDDIIISLEVLPQKDSVMIRYETNMYTHTIIRWGKTSSYELGSLAEQAFSKKHETQISGLTPGTLYYFTIEGEDRFGREGTLYTGMFTTLAPVDTFPPGNVTNLTATRDDDDVVLSWENPRDPDFSYVRVVRNDRFYPTDEVDGWVVYEGRASGFRDEEAVTGTQQFYTVFSYDALGNMSSGAVVVIRFGVYVPPETGTTSSTTMPLPGEIIPHYNPIALSFDDVEFIQEGEVLHPVHGSVNIDGAKQLTISVPYNRVPEHLKTILVTIRESAESTRSFDFLLRVNAEHTAYVSTLAPFGVSGTMPVVVSVFDYTTAQIGYTQGFLVSRIQPSLHTEQDETQGFMAYLFTLIRPYFLWFIVVLCILMLIVWQRMKRRE